MQKLDISTFTKKPWPKPLYKTEVKVAGNGIKHPQSLQVAKSLPVDFGWGGGGGGDCIKIYYRDRLDGKRFFFGGGGGRRICISYIQPC